MKIDTPLAHITGGKAPDPMPHQPPFGPGDDQARRRVDEVPLHSEMVEDVLGVAPRWIVRWGNTLIMGLVGALFSLTWIVHYPDVVGANVTVTSTRPPSDLRAPTSGELTQVRVKAGDMVRRDQVLAVIGNAADPQAVFALQDVLKGLGDNLDRAAFDTRFPDNLNLGDIQPEYSAFIRACEAYRYDVQHDPVNAEIRRLEPQLPGQRQRLASLQAQHDSIGQQVTLSERDMRRAAELAAQHMVSQRDKEARERDVLLAKQGLAGTEVGMAEARVELDKLSQSLTNLRMKQGQQREDLRLALAQAGKNLRSRIAVWERDYVLRAPVDGRISLSKLWSDHQFVKNGDPVMAVVQEGKPEILGRLSMPLANSGKVKLGQKVFIRLDNFPWQEFGQIKGIVHSISPAPQEARYLVEVTLPEGLHTSYGKDLDWHQDMQGQASIVVEDLRLIERVFYQLRKAFVGAVAAPDAPSL